MMMVMTYLKKFRMMMSLEKLSDECNDIFEFFLMITETYLKKFTMMVMTNLKNFPMMPKTYLRNFMMMVITYLMKILMRTKTCLRKFLMMVMIYLKAFYWFERHTWERFWGWRVFQGCFMGVSRVFNVSFKSL